MLVMEGGGFMFPTKPAKARRNGPGGAGPYSTLDGEPKANATDGWKEVGRDLAYECGKDPIGGGSARFSVKFYLVAMIFILFDIEVIFMYPWPRPLSAALQKSWRMESGG